MADAWGITPLHEAANKGDAGAVKCLIKQGADVNKGDKFNNTPLHFAAVGGYKEVVEHLLNGGADVNAKRGGMIPATALHLAAQHGRTDVVEILIHKGADRNIRDGSNKTPLDYAVEKNYQGIMDILSEPV